MNITQITTQKQMVVDNLKEYRNISPMNAFYELGITKLATRISELIRDGYTFKKVPMTTMSRFGGKVRYMTYELESEPKRRRRA